MFLSGNNLVEEGDAHSALLWFVETLRLDQGGSGAGEYSSTARGGCSARPDRRTQRHAAFLGRCQRSGGRNAVEADFRHAGRRTVQPGWPLHRDDLPQPGWPVVVDRRME